MANKKKDCPLAPDKFYFSGLKENGEFVGFDEPLRRIDYTPPCVNWDNGICNWFDPPQRVSEILKKEG